MLYIETDPNRTPILIGQAPLAGSALRAARDVPKVQHFPRQLRTVHTTRKREAAEIALQTGSHKGENNMDRPLVFLAASRGGELEDGIRSVLATTDLRVRELGLRHVPDDVQTMAPALALVVAGPGRSDRGMDIAAQLRSADERLPVIVVVQESSETQAIQALRIGVCDYIRWPAEQELSSSIRRNLYHRRPPRPVRPGPAAPAVIDRYLIGRAPAMRRIKDYLRKVAAADTCVLISGETGTGKERVAELVHRHSARGRHRLVRINCAAVPEALLESELFGYEKGAFTGANTAYEGKLKLAEGGTVFFDEIGEMSPLAQTKILRAIETKEIFRLGGRRELPVDFRVVAATNRSLEDMIAEGGFRKDLYYRLNVARIHLPPLRERKEDIPLLVEDTIEQMNPRFGTRIEGVDEQAMGALLHYAWPGNVRELKNAIEVAFINQPAGHIGLHDLPETLQRSPYRSSAAADPAESERDILLAALVNTNWNKSQTAKTLNWSRMTVYRKMHKYQIRDREQV